MPFIYRAFYRAGFTDGFSTAAEWATDVFVNSKTAGGDVLGNATITAVPLEAPPPLQEPGKTKKAEPRPAFQP